MVDNPWLRRKADTIYPKGSIVICPHCYRPVWALERGIGAMDRPGSSASAFRPLTRADIDGLLERFDIDRTWRLSLMGWRLTEAGRAVMDAPSPRAGDPMDCPNPHCDGCWAIFTHRPGEPNVHDRNYTLTLLTAPPLPKGSRPWGRRWKMDPHPREDEITIFERSAS